jgi:hypothetical protein
MKWLRLYNETAANPDWRMVALDTGQPVHVVVAVWTAMLCHASAANPRGTLAGWNDKRTAAMLDLSAEHIDAIRQAMQGVSLDGERLSAWDDEQFASDNVTARSQRCRDKKRAEATPETVAAPTSNGDATLQATDATFPPLRATDTDSDTDSPNGEEKKKKKRPPKADTSPEFEAFWQEFPEKVAKPAAWKAFQVAIRKIPFDQMMHAVRQYRHKQARPNARYPCYPATWLNNERWNDQPTQARHDQHPYSGGKNFQPRGTAAAASLLDEELEGHDFNLYHPGGRPIRH